MLWFFVGEGIPMLARLKESNTDWESDVGVCSDFLTQDNKGLLGSSGEWQGPGVGRGNRNSKGFFSTRPHSAGKASDVSSINSQGQPTQLSVSD